MDAPILSARRGDLQPCALGVGRAREDREHAGGKFSRLAFPPFQQRIHGFARTNLSAEPRELESDPAVVLRLLEFIGRHGISLAPETERRLEAAKSAFAAYCAQPRPLWATLESVLSLPRAALAMRTLQRAGLLAALFPEWAPMVDLVDTEPEHRYTVDEHTLMTVERATELGYNTDPTRQRFAQLFSEIENPAVLVFALLFHAAGQGTANGDPIPLSITLARQAMERIRVPGEEQREVNFLIEHQSDLAEVMSGRDVDDPVTARQLAERVGTIERLKLLTVMTYGDLAAVGSDAMTPWRLERLWRAYEVTQHELTRELETDRIQDVPDSVPGRPAFLKGFPIRYLRAHSPAEIEEHIRLYEESRPTGVAVQLDRIEGAYRLTVIARDMPALFASFAGALSSFGLDILKAEAFSNTAHHLDTFVFADPQRTLDLNPAESDRLLDLIRRVALGKTDGRGCCAVALRWFRKTQRATSGEFRFRRLRYRHPGGDCRRGPARLCCYNLAPYSPPPPAISMSCSSTPRGIAPSTYFTWRTTAKTVARAASDAEGKAAGCVLKVSHR